MIDELRLNTKFLGTDGIIGRYDFCYNLIYLGMIALFFSLPLNLYLITNLGTLEDILNLNKVWAEASLLLKFWTLIGGILCSYIVCINANRRLNDINGKILKDINLIFSALFILNAFYGKLKNKKIASQWLESNKVFFENNYAHLGFSQEYNQKSINLMKPISYNAFSFFATGRVYVNWMVINLTLKKRQDLISRIISFFYFMI